MARRAGSVKAGVSATRISGPIAGVTLTHEATSDVLARGKALGHNPVTACRLGSAITRRSPVLPAHIGGVRFPTISSRATVASSAPASPFSGASIPQIRTFWHSVSPQTRRIPATRRRDWRSLRNRWHAPKPRQGRDRNVRRNALMGFKTGTGTHYQKAITRPTAV